MTSAARTQAPTSQPAAGHDNGRTGEMGEKFIQQPVLISVGSAEACLAVFEAIPLLRDASVATELRSALRDYDNRVGQCPGDCHDRDEDDCVRCCSGRYGQVCNDCMAAS